MPMGKGTYGSMRGRPMKKKKVVGKRKKLDMDKDGKLTKKDFAMLRNKKKTRVECQVKVYMQTFMLKESVEVRCEKKVQKVHLKHLTLQKQNKQ